VISPNFSGHPSDARIGLQVFFRYRYHITINVGLGLFLHKMG
jgi:hypothetical protein